MPTQVSQLEKHMLTHMRHSMTTAAELVDTALILALCQELLHSAAGSSSQQQSTNACRIAVTGCMQG
jgi:hypothetical protein